MENYQKYFNFVYKIAYSFVGKKEIAEDIASQTIYYLLLNQEKIKMGKIYAWLYSTTKNNVRLYFRKNKYNIKFKNKLYLNIKNHKNSEDEVNFIKESYLIAKKYLTDSEKKLLELFLKNNLNIKDISKIYNIKPENMKKRIYLLKKKIYAYTYKEFGFTSSKDIIPPQINRKIIEFLNKLKLALYNKDYNMIKKFLTNEQINYVFKKIKIRNIKSFEVNLEDGFYKFVILYSDFNDLLNIFFIKVKINRYPKTDFDILEIEKKENKKIFSLSLDSLNGQALLKLLKNAKRNKDGTLNIPDAIIEKLIEDYQKEDN